VKHLFATQDYAPDIGGMARRHVELGEKARKQLAEAHKKSWSA